MARSQWRSTTLRLIALVPPKRFWQQRCLLHLQVEVQCYSSYHVPVAVPANNGSVTAIYAITLKWPEKGELMMKDIASMVQGGEYKVRLTGNEDTIQYKVTNGVAVFTLPLQDKVKSKDAWTLEFTLQK